MRVENVLNVSENLKFFPTKDGHKISQLKNIIGMCACSNLIFCLMLSAMEWSMVLVDWNCDACGALKAICRHIAVGNSQADHA